MISKKKIAFLFIIPFIVFGCKEKFTPKPRAYFRIDFPEKKYQPLQNGYPYQFEIPVYSEINKDPYNPDKPFWINVSVPANRAEIHISYYDFCLLYTSDAADDLLCVDLGGRRIIKKK